MRNHWGFRASVLILYTCCAHFVGCAGLSGGSKAVETVAKPGEVELQLKGDVGRTEVIQYQNVAVIEAFQEGQKVRQKEETTDFTTETIYEEVEGGDESVQMLVRTTAKDGPVQLNELAFPELEQSVRFLFESTGDVIQVEDRAKSSVFYLPPIPLPDQPVQVGETWSHEHQWTSNQNQISLELRIIGILKNVYRCSSGRCADIELSGDVKMAQPAENLLGKFRSELKGRVLFSMDQGAILWSEVNSQETLETEDGRVRIHSCLVSHLKEPESDSWPHVDRVECQPKPFDVPSVPGT